MAMGQPGLKLAVAPERGSAPDILTIKDVYKVFVSAGGAKLALRSIDLSVRRGEFLCLLGPSGCGKSTVLNMIAGLEAPMEGSILHHGIPVAGVNTRVG